MMRRDDESASAPPSPLSRRELRAGVQRAAAAAALALGLVACAREPARPNLVLISIDTLRPDHLGAYGYPRATSPAIDRLAAQGVVFERAYSTSNWTLPAHVSMLTGLWPAEHGVVGFGLSIGDGVELLPEALGRLGYARAGVVSAVPFLRRNRGFARGFEVYDDSAAYPATADSSRTSHHRTVTSEAAVGRALELLGELPGRQPFFLFLHLFDVHDDYVPPAPYDTMFAPGDGVRVDLDGRERRRPAIEARAALYDGEIRWVDSWLGRLFDELARRELDGSTLVVLTADHGEEFYEHGLPYHGKNLYDTSVRVPLVVRFPDRAHAGRRVATPVSLVDLGATLLAAAGGGEPTWKSGRDLAELLGPAPPAAWNERPLHFLGTAGRGHGFVAGLLADGRKLVVRSQPNGEPMNDRVLSLPTSDPSERKAERTNGRRQRRYRTELLAAWQQQQAHRPRPEALPAATVRAEEAELRALGYL